MGPSHITSKHSMFHLLILFAVVLSVAGIARGAADPLLTTLPPKPIRMPAEFEPMQGVIATTEMAVEDFAREVTEDVNLVLLGNSESEYARIQRNFQQWGVNVDHCEFHRIGPSPVPRDGLPWFIFIDHDKPASVYNRPYDDKFGIPQYGLDLGYPVYRSGILLEGGDFMTEGQGIGVSLDGVTIAHAEMGDEFTQQILDYWGIHTYRPVANARWGVDGYMHIDCLAKFLSPDTVMVVRVPPTDVRREQSEETAAYFGRQVSCYGTPYEVVRVDVPDREPYINSLILNRKVFVPMLDVAADADAIASYEAAMPGYEVIGIGGVWWDPFFALHCHTMNVPDEQMLYIEHTPLLDRPPTSEGFPIGAKIVALSQTEFVEGTPMVVWRALEDANELQLDNDVAASWQTDSMVRVPELGDHQCLAYIPPQPVGTVIQYYLRAQDASGRDETHPYIGEPQAHTFTVAGLGASASAVSAQRGGTIEIYMNAGADNAGLDYSLSYSVCADPEEAEDQNEILPDTTVFTGFSGLLDEFGTATGRMTIAEPLPVDWVGRSLCLSVELDRASNTSLNTVRIQILD